MSKRLFTAGADVACRDKCLGSAALGASMQQGRGLCAGSEPGSALPPVRAAPQPQSCSLIAHLPSSHTAAQGKAGKDQSRTLYPALSGYEKPSQLLFPSSGGPWSVLRFPRGSSKPQQRGWPREPGGLRAITCGATANEVMSPGPGVLWGGFGGGKPP